MITRQHVMPYLNQPVTVHTHDGTIHHGILHSVQSNGIYLRQMRGNVGMVSGDGSSSPMLLNISPQADGDVTEAFFPFFFLPFLAIAALGPWGWWW